MWADAVTASKNRLLFIREVATATAEAIMQ